MVVHQNARLTPRGREALVRRVLAEGVTLKAAAAAFNVAERTARKWVARYLREGLGGLVDRSSRPHRSPRAASDELRRRMEELRRLRWSMARISRDVGLSKATVARHLARVGLSRLKTLEPVTPCVRYERERPGELIHLDIKKLGRIERAGHRVTNDRSRRARGAGWEFLFVAVDDASRASYVELRPNERKESATAFLEATIRHYERLGVRVERVMTDNGSCFVSKAFREALRERTIRHLRTRPYTPRTNGKAERFIQTALREWAYARAYTHSDHRAAALKEWLAWYNIDRPHGSLDGRPPVCRLPTDRNNVLRIYN